jgi:hypothetical protein
MKSHGSPAPLRLLVQHRYNFNDFCARCKHTKEQVLDEPANGKRHHTATFS